MARGAAASTTIEGGQAASQALLLDGGDSGRAIDAVVAGVLAIAARRPGVLLGAGVILLGGTGEGARVVDGRARQPGLGAQRPRGFATLGEVPDAGKIAVPGLPAALLVAHAGRGVRTTGYLSRLATTTAESLGKIDAQRVASIHAFGRAGPMFLRAGTVRDALLAAGARSLGGTLTPDDLDAATAVPMPARSVDVAGRHWIVAPFRDPLTPPEPVEGGKPPAQPAGDVAIEIVAAVDGQGAFAIACVAVPALTRALEGTGLAAPLLAEPILRGVTRLAPATTLPMPAPIGIAQPRVKEAGADLVLGVGARVGCEPLFAALAQRASDPTTTLDALSEVVRAGALLSEGALACGVMLDSRGDGHAIVDPRRR